MLASSTPYFMMLLLVENKDGVADEDQKCSCAVLSVPHEKRLEIESSLLSKVEMILNFGC